MKCDLNNPLANCYDFCNNTKPFDAIFSLSNYTLFLQGKYLYRYIMPLDNFNTKRGLADVIKGLTFQGTK